MLKILIFFIISIYSFSMTKDEANYDVINNIKKSYLNKVKNNEENIFIRKNTVNNFNGNWISGVNNLKWKLVVKLPQNGINNIKDNQTDNGIYVTKKIYGYKRVLMRVSNVGWHGYTYEMYYIDNDEYLKISKELKNSKFELSEENLDKYFKNFKIIYPKDPKDTELAYSPSSWIYRGGILEYRGYYYYFKGDDVQTTKFTLMRLDRNSAMPLMEFAMPSFKYKNNFTETEKLIWNSGELSSLDYDLGKLNKKCNKYLTGKDSEKYLKTKKMFLEDRDSNNNLEFMKLLYKKRIGNEKKLLENEKLKTGLKEVNPQKFMGNIKGKWKTKKYIYSPTDINNNKINANADIDIAGLDIKVNFLENFYKNKNIKGNYKVKKVIETTTLNARQHFKYNKYGSYGGNIDLVPYNSKYYLISLEDEKTKDIAYMVYSTNDDGKSMLIFDPNYGVWSSSEDNISNKAWITDGYLLSK